MEPIRHHHIRPSLRVKRQGKWKGGGEDPVGVLHEGEAMNQANRGRDWEGREVHL